MAKATRLEKVLSRHNGPCPAGRHDLVDSFKRLQSLVERLSSYLSRQELEGMLVEMSGQPSEAESQPLPPLPEPASEE